MLTSASLFVACTSSAPNAVRAYSPVVSGVTINDWFLPSQDELNAMCNYSRNPTTPAAPTVSCYGTSGTTQDAAFAAGAFGFAAGSYWSSSEFSDWTAWYQWFGSGEQDFFNKINTLKVRPVRAF